MKTLRYSLFILFIFQTYYAYSQSNIISSGKSSITYSPSPINDSNSVASAKINIPTSSIRNITNTQLSVINVYPYRIYSDTNGSEYIADKDNIVLLEDILTNNMISGSVHGFVANIPVGFHFGTLSEYTSHDEIRNELIPSSNYVYRVDLQIGFDDQYKANLSLWHCE